MEYRGPGPHHPCAVQACSCNCQIRPIKTEVVLYTVVRYVGYFASVAVHEFPWALWEFNGDDDARAAAQ